LNNILKHIDQQIEFNKGKNLFHIQGKDFFQFIPEIETLAKQIANVSPNDESFLLEYVSNKAMEEFCRINQYYSFNAVAKEKLIGIYAELFRAIKNNPNLSELAKVHFEKLKNFLLETNHFSEKLYGNENLKLKNVTCSEYSPELQLEVLKIDISTLQEPVLDIGCGKNATLVLCLRKMGIEAFGFDRLVDNKKYCSQTDWFDYHFKTNHWGTIISNLGFSNHFMHHHLRTDGNYIEYAKKYMEILRSLKCGGTFYYSPGVPFIEGYLDSSEYIIKTHKIKNTDFTASRIMRLSK